MEPSSSIFSPAQHPVTCPYPLPAEFRLPTYINVNFTLSRPRFSKWPLTFQFPFTISVFVHLPSVSATCITHLILRALIILVTDGVQHSTCQYSPHYRTSCPVCAIKHRLMAVWEVSAVPRPVECAAGKIQCPSVTKLSNAKFFSPYRESNHCCYHACLQ